MALQPDWTLVPTDYGIAPDRFDGTQYTEALSTGDLSTSQGNPGVTRIFYCLYDVVPAFLDSLLGYSVGLSSQVNRFLPDPHPLYANMFAVEAAVSGVGEFGRYETTQMAKYKVAKITAVYRSPTYEIKADIDITNELDRYVTRQYSFGGDFITINSCGMKFVSNYTDPADTKTHLALTQPPARPTMTMEMTYTWHWVPPYDGASPYIPPNLTKIKDCYGRVNSAAFDTAHMNCPAGTVLFLGIDPRLTNYRIVTGEVTSNIYWEIAMKFIYRDNGIVTRGADLVAINERAGHQFLWDQGKGWWDLITNDGLAASQRLFLTADINTLFTLG